MNFFTSILDQKIFATWTFHHFFLRHRCLYIIHSSLGITAYFILKFSTCHARMNCLKGSSVNYANVYWILAVTLQLMQCSCRHTEQINLLSPVSTIKKPSQLGVRQWNVFSIFSSACDRPRCKYLTNAGADNTSLISRCSIISVHWFELSSTNGHKISTFSLLSTALIKHSLQNVWKHERKIMPSPSSTYTVKQIGHSKFLRFSTAPTCSNRINSSVIVGWNCYKVLWNIINFFYDVNKLTNLQRKVQKIRKVFLWNQLSNFTM